MPCVCSVAVAARGIVPAGRRGSLPCGVFSSRGTALRRLGGPWYLFGGGEREGANCFLCRAGESAPRLGWGFSAAGRASPGPVPGPACLW